VNPTGVGGHPSYVAIWHDHKTLLGVVAIRLALGQPRRAEQQRYRAELVKREEARTRRRALHSQRRFELPEILFGCGSPWRQLNMQIEIGERNSFGNGAPRYSVMKLPAQRFVHVAENEIIGRIRANLGGRLVEIALR
jgi:hypothetical protein